MNDTIIEHKNSINLKILFDSAKKIGDYFDEQYREIFLPNSEGIYNALSIRNHNFYLDCAEYDDNISRIYKQISNMYDEFIYSCETFDKNNGIAVKEDFFENSKDVNKKRIILSFTQRKHELKHQINLLEKDTELKVKEFSDNLSMKEKEVKAKVLELERKLSIDIQRAQQDNLNKCKDIEMSLLKTNDTAKISNLKQKQKEIRIEGIEIIANLQRACEVEKKDLENNFIKYKNEVLLSIKQYEYESFLKKIEYDCDLHIINFKLVNNDKYYQQFYLQNYVDELINLKNDFQLIVNKANEDRYLSEKDILQLRLKQVGFLKKEFMYVFNDFIQNDIKQMKTYFKVFKEYVNLYLSLNEMLLANNRLEKDDFTQLIDLLSTLINQNYNMNLTFVKSLVSFKESKISYLDYSLDWINESIIRFVEASKLNSLEVLQEIKDLLVKRIRIDKLISKVSEKVKIIYNLQFTIFESIEFMLSNVKQKAQAFIDDKIANAIKSINNDSIEVDKEYLEKTLNDLVIPNNFINQYLGKEKQIHKMLDEIDRFIDRVGIIDKEKANDIKSEELNNFENYKELRSKLLNSDIKQIQNIFKSQMKKIEKQRVLGLGKL